MLLRVRTSTLSPPVTSPISSLSTLQTGSVLRTRHNVHFAFVLVAMQSNRHAFSELAEMIGCITTSISAAPTYCPVVVIVVEVIVLVSGRQNLG